MENVIWQDNQMAMIVGIQFQVEKDDIDSNNSYIIMKVM